MKEVTLPAESASGHTEEQKRANIALAPEFKAAVTAQAYAPLIGETDLASVLKRLGEMSTGSVKDNARDIEYMLTSQAIALDSIFNRLAIQAHASMGKHPKVVDTYLRLALKAQSQCRATAETLANLKSPRQYISQTNVATALQVNIERDSHHVDTGTKGSNAASDPNLEALGEIHRATDESGKDNLQQKRTETRSVFGGEFETDFKHPQAARVNVALNANEQKE
jgi:hypothetical protein